MAVAKPTHLLIFNNASGTSVTNYGTVTTPYVIQQGSSPTNYEWVAQAQTPTGGYLDCKTKGTSSMPWMSNAATAFSGALETICLALGFTVDSRETVVGQNLTTGPDATNSDARVVVMAPTAGGNFNLLVQLNSDSGDTSGPETTFTNLTFGTFYQLACSLDVTDPAAAVGRFKLNSAAVVTPATKNMAGHDLNLLHPWLNRHRDFTSYGGTDGRYYYLAYQRGGTAWSATDLADINANPSTAITGWPGVAADTPLTVTGGQLALAGSDVTLSAAFSLVADGGQLAFAGSDVGLLYSESSVLAVDGASLALEGSVIVLAPSIAQTLVVDGAQMVLAGSEVPFILEQPYESGEIALQGSEVLLNSGPSLTLNITPGSIALEGGTASLTIPTTAGELVIQGSDLAMTQSSALALVVDAGALVLAGQAVGFDMTLWVLPDQIALTGQDVTLTHFVEALVAGQLALQGSSVELIATGTNLPSEIEGGPIEGESDFAHRIDTDYLETSPKS